MSVATPPSVQQSSTRYGIEGSEELALLDIAGQAFALPITAIVAVLDPQQMDRSQPGDEGLWIGELATRSGVIPVADSRRVFSLPQAGPVGRVLVLRSEPLLALAVDGLLGSLLPGRGDVQLLPELCGSRAQLLVDAMVWNGDEPLLRIAPDALVAWLLHGTAMPGDGAGQSLPAFRESVEPRDGQVLLVRVSGELCALPVGHVRHISDDREAVRLPRARAAFTGLVAWERAPIPVVDVAFADNRTAIHDRDRMLVVIGALVGASQSQTQPLAALRVEEVTGVAWVTEWRADAVLLADGRAVRQLDLHMLLTAISDRLDVRNE